MILKLQKEISHTLSELASQKTDAKSRNAVSILEKEVKRLQEYVQRLSEVEVPKR